MIQGTSLSGESGSLFTYVCARDNAAVRVNNERAQEGLKSVKCILLVNCNSYTTTTVKNIIGLVKKYIVLPYNCQKKI